jgi:hypothetical protein
MGEWQSQVTGWLLTTLLCGGFVGGTTSTPQSSCLVSSLTSEASRRGEFESSHLARGYSAVEKGDLLYCMEVMDKLWRYFIDEAESFTPEEMAMMDREFRNLG